MDSCLLIVLMLEKHVWLSIRACDCTKGFYISESETCLNQNASTTRCWCLLFTCTTQVCCSLSSWLTSPANKGICAHNSTWRPQRAPQDRAFLLGFEHPSAAKAKVKAEGAAPGTHLHESCHDVQNHETEAQFLGYPVTGMDRGRLSSKGLEEVPALLSGPNQCVGQIDSNGWNLIFFWSTHKSGIFLLLQRPVAGATNQSSIY